MCKRGTSETNRKKETQREDRKCRWHNEMKEVNDTSYWKIERKIKEN